MAELSPELALGGVAAQSLGKGEEQLTGRNLAMGFVVQFRVLGFRVWGLGFRV